MNFTHELEEPFKYSWSIVITIAIIIVIVVLAYVIFRNRSFFYKMYQKFFKKAQVPSLKRIYIFKLERLMNDVRSGKIDVREAYVKLSIIIRDFIQKTTGINVLCLSKEEVYKMNIQPLSMLMNEYYPPEFAKYANGDIVNSIGRTIEVIKQWN